MCGPLQALIVAAPSRGINWADLGTKSLVGLPSSSFSRLTFSLPPSVATAFSGTYSDLTLHVVINGSSGSYLVDQLAFAAPSAGPTVSTFSIQLPSGVSPQDMFMSSTDRLQLDDQVVAGTATELERIANFGASGLEIGSIAQVHADVLNAAGTTLLRSRSHTRGAVRAAGLIETQEPVFVDGGRFPGSTIKSGITSWQVSFPATNAGPIYRGPDLLGCRNAPYRPDGFRLSWHAFRSSHAADRDVRSRGGRRDDELRYS